MSSNMNMARTTSFVVVATVWLSSVALANGPARGPSYKFGVGSWVGTKVKGPQNYRSRMGDIRALARSGDVTAASELYTRQASNPKGLSSRLNHLFTGGVLAHNARLLTKQAAKLGNEERAMEGLNALARLNATGKLGLLGNLSAKRAASRLQTRLAAAEINRAFKADPENAVVGLAQAKLILQNPHPQLRPASLSVRAWGRYNALVRVYGQEADHLIARLRAQQLAQPPPAVAQ